MCSMRATATSEPVALTAAPGWFPERGAGHCSVAAPLRADSWLKHIFSSSSVVAELFSKSRQSKKFLFFGASVGNFSF